MERFIQLDRDLKMIKMCYETDTLCIKCLSKVQPKPFARNQKRFFLLTTFKSARKMHQPKWSLRSVIALLFLFPHLSTCSPSSLSASTKAQDLFLKNDQILEDEMQATQATSCLPIEPPFLKTEEKIVLSPIVFQGQLNTKSNVLNSVYHVTFRVFKIYKGKLPTKQHKHVRLVFQTELHMSSSRKRIEHDFDDEDDEDNNDDKRRRRRELSSNETYGPHTKQNGSGIEDDEANNIKQTEFSVYNTYGFYTEERESDVRYNEENIADRQPKHKETLSNETHDLHTKQQELEIEINEDQPVKHRELFSESTNNPRPVRSVVLPPCVPVRFNVQAGRYVPFALPDDYTKKTRRLLKKYSCPTCASPAKVSDLRPSLTATEGSNVKFKCKLSGMPSPTVTWHKNGIQLKQDFRFSIKSKKKRSQLRITDVHRRDSGKYSCSAKNILGEDSQTSSLVVRFTAPDPPPSSCPIESFCLNDGKCFYYEMIGELICKCTEGYAGQRCQFKKARINLPLETDACGPYGHDIHLREICAAWKRPPVTEMSREEYDEWLKVEQQLAYLRKQKELEQMEKFRQMTLKRNMTDTGYNKTTERKIEV